MSKKQKKVVNTEAAPVAVTTVYIGKTLLGLSRFTVFKDGVLPSYVAEIASKSEAVRGLIVPVNELQEARRNMTVKGHILNYYATKQKEENHAL